MQQLLRQLPQVGRLLEKERWQGLLAAYDREQVKSAIETELALARADILAGGRVPTEEELQLGVERRLARLVQAGPGPVLNATGVIIHTNLGRAPLAPEAIAAASQGAGYCNLELDLATGERGSRHAHVEELLCRLTGAQAAMAVNNNAAAVMLALAGVAKGREGIIARGQLVEIGGSFRVPEVMAESGIRLVEVGTTNRVYIEDYRRAISPETGVILRVHPSNFRVLGFQEEVPLAQLATLAREHGLPLLDDLGSGTIVDLAAWGIQEPTVQQSLAAGADLVCFSGDKLLGGPQCGLILGEKNLVARLKSHPLARALRCDKLTLAALAATLALYIKPEGWRRIPVLAMLSESPQVLAARAEKLAGALRGLPATVAVVTQVSPVGGGALPLLELETRAVRIEPLRMGVGALARALRLGCPPLVARIHEGALVFDVRTLGENEIDLAAQVLARALAGEANG